MQLQMLLRFNSKSKEFEYSKLNKNLVKVPEDIYDYLTNPKIWIC